MKRLNEAFEVRAGQFTSKEGKVSKIVYITSTEGEQLYNYTNIVKKYGAKWLPTLKLWGWFISDKNQFIIDSQIKPCIQELNNAKQSEGNGNENGNGNEESNDVIKVIENLQDMLSNVDMIDDLDAGKIDTKIIESNLEKFKLDLLNSLSAEEFKKKLEPIIKFKRANGPAFSLYNTLLIYMQMPTATMVKKKSLWLQYNKVIKPNEKPLAIFVPNGVRNKFSKNDKEDLINKYLEQYNVSTYDELPIGVQELIMSQSNMVVSPKSYKLAPYFYDISQTEQKPGTDDVVGTPNVDLPWFEENGEETEEIATYIQAMKNVIQKNGIQLSSVEDLNGARGVSKSGSIDVLENVPQNIGTLNTLIHEFAHEILHQKYLKSKNDKFKEFYRGTKEGRQIVEQQAELTAWIVLMHFGYNLQTSKNYVSMWGMDEKNAVFVFDTISIVANKIVEELVEELENMENQHLNENVNNVRVPGLLNITGEEVAELCGYGDLYQQGVDEKIDAIYETFYNILNKIK